MGGAVWKATFCRVAPFLFSQYIARMLWRSSRGQPLNVPATFIHPCQAVVAKQPPIGPGSAHELKHDGYRLQIHVRDGHDSSGERASLSSHYRCSPGQRLRPHRHVVAWAQRTLRDSDRQCDKQGAGTREKARISLLVNVRAAR
jgi:hypothetical protein